MAQFFKYFWSFLIFASIAWYGFLVFIVAYRGGKDVLEMFKNLEEQNK